MDEIFYMSFTTNRDPMNALNRDFLKRTLFQIGYYANTKILKLIHADKADKIIGQYFKVDPGLTRNISDIKKALDLTLRL